MRVDGWALQALGHTAEPRGTAASRVQAARGADFDEDLADAREPARPATTYEVRPGDNLSTIVRNHAREQGRDLSPAEVWQGVLAVARANSLSNPDYILPGQTLDLAVLGHAAHSTPAAPAPPVSAPPIAGPPRSTAAAVSATTPSAPEAAAPAAPAAPAPVPEARTSPMPVAALTHPAPGVSALSIFPMTGHAPEAVTTPAARATARVVRPHAVQRTGGIGGPPYVRTRRDELEVFQLTAGVRYRKPDELGAAAAAEDPAVTKASIAQPWAPLLGDSARLTSGFGRRSDPFTGAPDFHRGIDLAAKIGTRIHPLRPGTVTFSGWQSGYGKVVIVRHDDGLETVYGHNATNMVRKGQRVATEDVLGLVGSTGRSTGPHLHFEVREKGRAVDPMPYLETARTPARIARN